MLGQQIARECKRVVDQCGGVRGYDFVVDGGVGMAVQIDQGRAQAEASFVLRLQSLGGFGGKADQLNAYNVYLDAPDSFDTDLDRYLQATEDKVRRTAAEWLDRSKATALSVVPEGRRDLAATGADDVMWSIR